MASVGGRFAAKANPMQAMMEAKKKKEEAARKKLQKKAGAYLGRRRTRRDANAPQWRPPQTPARPLRAATRTAALRGRL